MRAIIGARLRDLVSQPSWPSGQTYTDEELDTVVKLERDDDGIWHVCDHAEIGELPDDEFLPDHPRRVELAGAECAEVSWSQRTIFDDGEIICAPIPEGGDWEHLEDVCGHDPTEADRETFEAAYCERMQELSTIEGVRFEAAYRERMQRSLTVVAVRVDPEHGGALWWAEARQRIDSCPAALRPLLAVGDEIAEVRLPWAEAEKAFAWCKSLPGWCGGPAYAPHPLIFDEL